MKLKEIFKEIFKQQEVEHKENMGQEVIKVNTKENIIRDATEKKKVIIHGLKDKIKR